MNMSVPTRQLSSSDKAMDKFMNKYLPQMTDFDTLCDVAASQGLKIANAFGFPSINNDVDFYIFENMKFLPDSSIFVKNVYVSSYKGGLQPLYKDIRLTDDLVKSGEYSLLEQSDLTTLKGLLFGDNT